MQEDKKKSKFAGIPYTIIIFLIVCLAVVTLPSWLSDRVTRQEIRSNRTEIIKLENAFLITPTASASATPTVTPTATPAAKRSFVYPTFTQGPVISK